MSDKSEICPSCHKEMSSHDLAQVNQCMKDFIKKLYGKTPFDTKIEESHSNKNQELSKGVKLS